MSETGYYRWERGAPRDCADESPVPATPALAGAPRDSQKSFWFFFSKKNFFLEKKCSKKPLSIERAAPLGDFGLSPVPVMGDVQAEIFAQRGAFVFRAEQAAAA